MASDPLTRCDFESKDLLVKVDLTLPGDVNAISPVVAKVMAIVTEMGCAAGGEFQIPFALLEPMLPLAFLPLWGARHGTFPARPTAAVSR